MYKNLRSVNKTRKGLMLITINSSEYERGSYKRELPFIETTGHVTSISTRGVMRGGGMHPMSDGDTDQTEILTVILFNVRSYVRLKKIILQILAVKLFGNCRTRRGRFAPPALHTARHGACRENRDCQHWGPVSQLHCIQSLPVTWG